MSSSQAVRIAVQELYRELPEQPKDLRATIAAEVEITVEAEQDDMAVRGNAIASGDDKYDKRVENRIIRRLDDGDVWAWAAVTVKGTWRGLEHCEYIGGCSYKSERDFRKNSGYFDDMRETVIGELVSMAEAIRA